MTVYTPATYDALRMTFRAALALGEPVAVRYPNAVEDERVKARFYPDGQPDLPSIRTDAGVDGDPEVLIAVHGRMASEALDISEALTASGYRAGVILCEYIKPYTRLADEIETKITKSVRLFVTLEEEIRSGGFGENLCDALERRGAFVHTDKLIIATDDNFAIPAAGQTVYEAAGVDAAGAVAKINGVLEASKK